MHTRRSRTLTDALIARRRLYGAVAAAGPAPPAAYTTEDGSANYTTEDGSAPYTPS